MLTAGALALAVITPALEQVERGSEAVTTPLALPATPELAGNPLDPAIQRRQLDQPAPLLGADPLRNRLRELRFDAGIDMAPLREVLQNRMTSGERISRAIPRSAVAARPAPLRVRPVPPLLRRPAGPARPAVRPAERAAGPTREAVRPAGSARQVVRPAERAAGPARAVRPAERAAGPARAARPAERPVTQELRSARPTRAQVARPARKRVAVQRKRVTVAHRGVPQRTTRSSTVRRLRASGGSRDMRAVIAYARAQVGKRYVRGGEGPYGFDCSGFTKRAYARAGMALPHSSGGQARRARSVPRSAARPGDLVVGPGHVGIYMGRGMMIDAGNHRTGVVYRKLYRGLSVSRLH